MALTRQAHQLVRAHFLDHKGGLAIDATCGNGHDTEFLARLNFDHVLGFDVQESAISNTRKRFENTRIDHVELALVGHEEMGRFFSGKVACVMFNFGYLPKADRSITTRRDTSLKALKIALEHLDTNGLVCLICYPGHAEGAVETKAINSWLSTLGEKWRVDEYLSEPPKSNSTHSETHQPETPVLYTIKHKALG